MSNAVLDASAIIALLNQEAGTDQLTAEILSSAMASTVNLAEVHGKLMRDGIPADRAWHATRQSVTEAVEFTAEQAKAAGSLILETRPLGLSLGDRACLALAIERQAPVYTTDRSWKKLKLPVAVHVLR